MSHEVVFLPHILGQTWSQAVVAARTAAREHDPRIIEARFEPWTRLVLRGVEILGPIEEYRGRGQRELLHPVTRLRFTFFGEDGVIALPYWYDGPVARMAAQMAFRFAHAVEEETGLSAYDPQLRSPLAETTLDRFVAGYLRGREKALEQDSGRGRIRGLPELPPARKAPRRELPPAPPRPGSGSGSGSESGSGSGSGYGSASGSGSGSGSGSRGGSGSDSGPKAIEARRPSRPDRWSGTA